MTGLGKLGLGCVNSIIALAGKIGVLQQEGDMAHPPLIQSPTLCRPLAPDLLLAAQLVDVRFFELIVVVWTPECFVVPADGH